MQYKNLGKAGIKVSELSYGSWITFGKQMGQRAISKCIHYAFDQGVNFFDNAEVYGGGKAEKLMGAVLNDFHREDIVVSTKLFWGGEKPNHVGLSRKHLMEGIHRSLKYLKLDYVDLLYCHRPDPETPIDETVRAMDQIVRDGLAFYWGTSEWTADQLEEAYKVAKALNCIPPSMEQPEYNVFRRDRVEKELAPLCKAHGLGLTTWSPLASGVLTGKYNDGIPSGSRLRKESWLIKEDMQARIETVKALMPIAEEIGCSIAQLSIAWCMQHPNVSTVILGASSKRQLKENLQAAQFKEALTPTVMKRIDEILNKRS